MTDFQTGLVVSGVGLSITFLALLIFIGVIVALQKLFPPKGNQPEDKTYASLSSVPANCKDADEAAAAAIAAAIYIRSKRASQLGAALLSGPGPFRTSKK